VVVADLRRRPAGELSRQRDRVQVGPPVRAAQATKSSGSYALLPLLVGVGIGVLLAAAGLLSPSGERGRLPPEAVARVNGEIIRKSDFERVIEAVKRDRKTPIDEVERERLLDRLIDEELLVQRGIELGFTRHDPKVRADLTSAVIAVVTAQHEDQEPSDDELRLFYERERGFFGGPGRLRVRQVFCRVGDIAAAPAILERAQRAAERLRAGEEFAVVRSEVGDDEVAPLPDASLPLAKLVDYLGPTAARAAVRLEVGAVSEPIRSSTGYHVLQVVEREPDSAPDLEDIRPQVVAEFRRRSGERALREYLDDLRTRAAIEFGAGSP
jgi:hypothetical protein